MRTVTVSVALALIISAFPASAQALKEYSCGRAIDKNGMSQMVVDNSLHVLSQTLGPGRFDPGAAPAGGKVKSIFCARSDVVPAPGDYKVVAAGYPLMLFSRDAGGATRIAVLETDGGSLRLRSVGQAGFTPDMVQRIRMVLDTSIPQFKAAAR